MDLTPYHAKYYAFELTRRYSSNSLQKFTASLADAQVDLNPHQVDAALFADHYTSQSSQAMESGNC
jgi:hypothetical protein